MSSIFDISYEMNGPLPFYHPDHIIHYIMWGKMDLVHTALISLNRFLKQFVDDEDNIINEFPPVSFPKMLKLQNVRIFLSKQEKNLIGSHRIRAARNPNNNTVDCLMMIQIMTCNYSQLKLKRNSILISINIV